jgi:hypothetical protein
MPYEPTGSRNFVNPADGEHDAVVVGWEDRGINVSTYNGKEREVHQAVIQYEILDQTLPNEEQFGENAGKPLVLWDWINMAWGKRAKLTERRAAILGLDIDDVVNQDVFYENDLLGQRVIIYIKENENGNPKVLDVRRHQDQNYGTLENDLIATGFEEDPAGVNGRAPDQSKPQTSAPRSAPAAPSRPKAPAAPSAPKADSRSPEEKLIDAKTCFLLLVGACAQNELMDNDQEWIDWSESAQIDELIDNIKAFETTLKDADVALPKVEAHPQSTGDDDLPF